MQCQQSFHLFCEVSSTVHEARGGMGGTCLIDRYKECDGSLPMPSAYVNHTSGCGTNVCSYTIIHK
jgi:hypothetical protein